MVLNIDLIPYLIHLKVIHYLATGKLAFVASPRLLKSDFTLRYNTSSPIQMFLQYFSDVYCSSSRVHIFIHVAVVLHVPLVNI